MRWPSSPWGHASTGTPSPSADADTDGGRASKTRMLVAKARMLARPPTFQYRQLRKRPTQVTTPSGRSATAETEPVGASGGRVADVDMEIPPPGPRKPGLGPSVPRAPQAHDTHNLLLGPFAASGTPQAPVEQQRLTKVPAFEVHPRRDTILDGLRAFNTTGETILVASPQAMAPTWVCGGCDAPLAVGPTPDQLTKRVLRCGRCRSYNRAETN